MKTLRLPRWLEVFLAAVIIAELVAPFFSRIDGTDGPIQIYWTSQFWTLLKEGYWVPRWNPHGFFGYGAPTFYFYPPLFFYFTSLLKVLTATENPLFLLQLTAFFGTVASFGTALMLLRRIGAPSYQAVVGSALYAFAPFRLAELYMRSALPAYFSFIFLPLLWLGLYEIASHEKNYRGVMMTGISFALLFLSSIPTSIGSSAIILLMIFVERRRITPFIIKKLALSLFLFLALTAYQIVSIFEYKSLVDFSLLPGGIYYFIISLFKWENLPGVYYFVLIYAAIIILMISFLRRKNIVSQNEHIIRRLGLAVIILFSFLDCPVISEPVWKVIIKPVLATWRSYIYIPLLVALCAGVASSARGWKHITWITALWSFGTIIPLWLVLTRTHIFTHDTGGKATDAYEYFPLVSNFTFLDSAAREKGIVEPTAIMGSTGSNPDLKSFHQFYWPSRHLYQNNVEIKTFPDSVGRASGYISGTLGSLEWRTEKSPLETGGMWISGLAWGGIIAGSGISGVRTYQRKSHLRS